jgi:small nuclear ribonucleoprotein (snRNP)-like protein
MILSLLLYRLTTHRARPRGDLKFCAPRPEFQKMIVVQIVTNSQRKFVGTFTCFDFFGNILLFDAVEKVQQSGSKPQERHLNQIIVALRIIERVEVLVCHQPLHACSLLRS